MIKGTNLQYRDDDQDGGRNRVLLIYPHSFEHLSMSKLGSIMPVFSCFLFVSPQNLDEVIRSKPFFIQVTHSLHHEKVGLEDLDHVPGILLHTICQSQDLLFHYDRSPGNIESVGVISAVSVRAPFLT